MKKLTFDEYKELISSIKVPAQLLGIFRVKINNANKRYYFEGLKETASYNPDITGLSLNHYDSLGLPKQKFKRSKFHGFGDVSIDIWRHEFQYAYKVERFNEISLVMNTWTAQINW